MDARKYKEAETQVLNPMAKMKSFVISFVAVIFLASTLYAEEATEAPQKKVKRPSPIENLFNQQQGKVETVADSIEYSRDQKKVIAKGNVVLTYGDTQLTADYAEVETDTKKAFASGHVFIFKDQIAVAQGREVHYDFENESGNFPDGSLIKPPWYCRGQDIRQVREGVSEVDHGIVTTCEGSKPPYDVRAKKFTIYEGDKIVAWNVTLHVLNKPVFWLPYLVIPLQIDHPPVTAQAGYSTKWGAYILLSKGFSITENIYGRLHADWRSKRGFGGGFDVNYGFESIGRGIIRTYWTQDDEAPTPAGAFAVQEERDRGRISWRHRKDFDPHTFLLFRYERLADEFFLQDFFEKEFRAEVEPQSFATATKNTDKWGVFAHVQKRMNRFEALVERLPQIRFDWKNQKFFGTPVYYENQFSFDHLDKRFGRQPFNDDVNRADMFHEWSAPMKWRNFKFTPHANFRNTYYSRSRFDDNNRYRVAAGFGADLRTQFYKTFSTSFDKFGIEVNQLRHIIEPSVQYRAMRSTVSDETIGEFDSIDRVDDSDVITFGVENRFQTKRVIDGKMQRVDIVSLNTYLSYELHPDGRSLAGNFASFETGNTSSNFTLWSQEVVLRPYNWLQYEIRSDYDPKRGQFRVFNQDLLIRHEKYRFLVGHRFIRDLREIEGSNQFVIDGKWKINDIWALGGYIRWDTKQGEVEEWQVGATRDFQCLLLDFGYNVRNSDVVSGNNRELYFNLRLKAYPAINLKAGSRAGFGEPRIGETVAGANQRRTTNIYRHHLFS